MIHHATLYNFYFPLNFVKVIMGLKSNLVTKIFSLNETYDKTLVAMLKDRNSF